MLQSVQSTLESRHWPLAKPRHIAEAIMGGKTMNDERVGMSGLTEREAREFMKSYEKGMWTFVAIASLAHIAVWAWKPWFDFM